MQINHLKILLEVQIEVNKVHTLNYCLVSNATSSCKSMNAPLQYCYIDIQAWPPSDNNIKTNFLFQYNIM
jgi:hypothetical protein